MPSLARRRSSFTADVRPSSGHLRQPDPVKSLKLYGKYGGDMGETWGNQWNEGLMGKSPNSTADFPLLCLSSRGVVVGKWFEQSSSRLGLWGNYVFFLVLYACMICMLHVARTCFLHCRFRLLRGIWRGCVLGNLVSKLRTWSVWKRLETAQLESTYRIYRGFSDKLKLNSCQPGCVLDLK